MSWTDIKAANGGPVEFRLTVEGWPEEFITDGLAAGAVSPANGRTRVHGLMRQGLRWGERQHFVEPIGKIRGFRVSLADDRGNISAALRSRPSYVGYLTEPDLTKSETGIDVTTTAGVSDGDVLHIGTEAVRVNGTPTETTLTVLRGELQSVAVRHGREDGARRVEVEVTNRPVLMKGRRCWLYAHGPEETGTNATGTLAFKGVIGDEPRMRDATTWEVLLDPITRILDQDIGVDTESIEPVGIYYSNRGALHVRLVELGGADSDDAISFEAIIKITGFYANQAAFVDDLNTYIAAATTSWQNDYLAVQTADGRWTIRVETPSSGERYFRIYGGSVCDGMLTGRAITSSGGEVGGVAVDSVYFAQWSTSLSVASTVIPSGEPPAEDDEGILGEVLGLRTVPRASYVLGGAIGAGAAAELSGTSVTGPDPDYDTDAEDTHLYLAGTDRLTAGDIITIHDRSYTASTITPATGLVELDSLVSPTLSRSGYWTSESMPLFGASADFGSLADFADFINNLTSSSADFSGRLGVPVITTDDLNVSEIADVVAEVSSGKPFLSNRSYQFVETRNLREIIEQELLLLGCFMYLDSDWKLSIRPIRASIADEGTLTDPSSRVISGGFGSIEAIPDVVNSVEVKTHYAIDEEGKGEHRGPNYVVREVMSITRLRQRHRMTIAPEVVVDSPIASYSEALAVAAPYIALLGHPYEIITVQVPLSFYDTAVGEGVLISVPQLSADGSRGITNANCLVVGREWDIAGGRGTLTLLRFLLNVAGYSPSARVTAHAVVSGRQYDLTCSSAEYGPSSSTDAAFFKAGDAVALIERDDLTPRRYLGTVDTDGSGTTVRATFANTLPTLSGSTWVLEYASRRTVQTGQKDYAFLGDSTYLIAGDEPNRLGP